KQVKGKVTFLPEPARAKRDYLVISVDDHIVEPKEAFDGRMPAKFAEQAPHVIEKDGADVWVYDGQEFPNVGFNAVVGRPVDEWGFEPTRFVDMRRGSCRSCRALPASVCSCRRRTRSSRSRPFAPGTTGTSRTGRAPTPTG